MAATTASTTSRSTARRSTTSSGSRARARPAAQSGTQPVSLDAVEQFNVEVAPFDVRYGNFTGGLHQRRHALGHEQLPRLAARADAQPGLRRRPDDPGDGRLDAVPNFSDNLYIGTLGGPILRNKLFFFLSGEYATQQLPQRDGPDRLRLDQHLPGHARDGRPDHRHRAEHVRLRSRRLGPDLERPLVGQAARQDRLEHQPAAPLLAAQQLRPRRRRPGQLALALAPSTSRTGTTSSGARRTRRRPSSTRPSARGRPTRRASSTRAIRDNRDVDAASRFPSVSVCLTTRRRVQTGVERSSQANSLDQDLFEFTDNLSYTAAQHAITLGTSNQLFRFRNLFIQDFYGSYEFRAIGADLDGDGGNGERPSTPSGWARRAATASRTRARSPSTRRAASSSAPTARRRAWSPRATPRGHLHGRPARPLRPGRVERHADLRLTVGLRLDLPVFPDTPTLNPLVSGGTAVDAKGNEVTLLPAFRQEAYVRAYARRSGLNEDATVAAYGTTAYTGPQFEDYSSLSTENVPNGNLLISPRLGVNYRTPTIGALSAAGPRRHGHLLGPHALRVDLEPVLQHRRRLRAPRPAVRLTPAPVGFFSGSADPATQPVPGVTPGLAPVATSSLALTDPGLPLSAGLALEPRLRPGARQRLRRDGRGHLHQVALRRRLREPERAPGGHGRRRPPALDGRPRAGHATSSTRSCSPTRPRATSTTSSRRCSAARRSGLGGSLSYTYGRAFAVNNATSWVAYSNWRFNESADPNDLNEVGTADFEVRHRVLGYANYRTEYAGRFSSQLGLVLDVRSGEPFSYIYSNDANGDGETSNDLVYVPASERDVFLTSGTYSAARRVHPLPSRASTTTAARSSRATRAAARRRRAWTSSSRRASRRSAASAWTSSSRSSTCSTPSTPSGA